METQVGVLVSQGYGIGWSSYSPLVNPCDKELVKAFEEELPEESIIAIAERLYPSVYTGGLLKCVVEYVPQGTIFKIEEHDGYETLEINYDKSWRVAN